MARVGSRTELYESVGEFRRRPESEPFFRLAKMAKQAMLGIDNDTIEKKKGQESFF